jgi:hypothetical protein
MIKNSKDYLAGRHPDAASHIDPARRSRAHACAARHQHAAAWAKQVRRAAEMKAP